MSLPHRLNVNGFAVIPQLVLDSQSGFTTTANSTNVTVTRTVAAASGNVNVYCEHWHTIEDLKPPGGLGSLVPFIAASGGGGSTIQHTQRTPVTQQELLNNGTTTVLTCPSFTPAAGSFVQATGSVAVQIIGNTTDTTPTAIAVLQEDGTDIAQWKVALPIVAVDGPTFDGFTAIPFAWAFVADGAAHVYSLAITTDSTSDGTWSANSRSMFVNAITP